MSYFMLGVDGEGYAFFQPDNYRKSPMVIGTGIRRTISGKAKQDIVAVKHSFEISFEWLSNNEQKALMAQFFKNVEDGKDLVLQDDEGTYNVMWSGNVFGLDNRVQHGEIYWSGSILLEEI